MPPENRQERPIIGGYAGNLFVIIDCVGFPKVSSERTQILDAVGLGPEKRVLNRVPGQK
jgi:hypothetical protein